MRMDDASPAVAFPSTAYIVQTGRPIIIIRMASASSVDVLSGTSEEKKKKRKPPLKSINYDASMTYITNRYTSNSIPLM